VGTQFGDCTAKIARNDKPSKAKMIKCPGKTGQMSLTGKGVFG
jgi:hypothetical protein